MPIESVSLPIANEFQERYSYVPIVELKKPRLKPGLNLSECEFESEEKIT
jgi:hypothetical protein